MIVGNLIDLAESGRFDAIIHGCNCFHTMGSGIAAQIKRRYPEAYAADLAYSEKGAREKLGTYTSYAAECNGNHFLIINAYTQYNYGVGKKQADYAAIKKVFTKLSEDLAGMRIGYPRIGCGLAGGEWRCVRDIIHYAMKTNNHDLVALLDGKNYV